MAAAVADSAAASGAVQIGLEQLATHGCSVLQSRRFALLMNRASVDRDVRLACDVLAAAFPGQLAALMTPQHGLWGEQQANMVETGHGWHAGLGVPVFSLYSETRRPTQQMLDGIDCLVIDLQDVGTRVYTFVWTLLYCLQACARRGVEIVVLDRPNPIGGTVVEGPLLQPAYRSFVGEAGIPMRHGLTLGELARLLQAEQQPEARLTVVPLQGWQRSLYFDELRRPWIPPSPNMPTVNTAVVYPGQVLLEGTNLSEGRGTTIPFEVVGAPFIDPDEFCRQLMDRQLPGVRWLPIRFTPCFDKWSGYSCGGVSLHVTDRSEFRAYCTTVTLLDVCRRLYPDEFKLNPPPYEYETRLAPIDIISGSNVLRRTLQSAVAVDDQASAATLSPAVDVDAAAWWQRCQPCLLY